MEGTAESQGGLEVKPPSDRRKTAAYLTLLSAQTAAATWLFCVIFPVFRQLLANIGVVQTLGAWDEVAIAGGVVALQSLYWIRLRFFPVATRIRSVFLGHVVRF